MPNPETRRTLSGFSVGLFDKRLLQKRRYLLFAIAVVVLVCGTGLLNIGLRLRAQGHFVLWDRG
jgi:hypothetical protein